MEQYKPTKKDISLAESMMSDEQKQESSERQEMVMNKLLPKLKNRLKETETAKKEFEDLIAGYLDTGMDAIINSDFQKIIDRCDQESLLLKAFIEKVEKEAAEE